MALTNPKIPALVMTSSPSLIALQFLAFLQAAPLRTNHQEVHGGTDGAHEQEGDNETSTAFFAVSAANNDDKE